VKCFGLAALFALVVFPVLALAQAAGIPDPSNLEEFAKLLFTAVSAGQWKLVAALALVALVWAVRRYGGKLWPWLLTDSGGAWTLVVTTLIGAVALALYTGTPVTLPVLWTALLAAAATGGGYALVRKLLRPLVPLVARLPGIGAGLAKLLELIVGQDPAAVVKAAADAAQTSVPTSTPGSQVAAGLDRQ
jgi:hypothetical protein